MIVLKCGDYDYEKADDVREHEPYLTVGELCRKLKWFDQDEAICVDTRSTYYPFRNIDDVMEAEE